MLHAHFVSDIHISRPDDLRARMFLDYLKGVASCKVTHLFLLGDIFDLWIGAHRYFITSYAEIISALKQLKEQDVEIHYFEGNHDLYLHDFWESELGFKVHRGPQLFELGPWKVRIEHGDEMDPHDKGYLFLRNFLRQKPVEWINCHLPGPLVKAIGERASQASRSYTSQQKSISNHAAIEVIRTHAQKKSRVQDFNYLISGHVHVVDEFAFYCNERRVISLNLGSWLGDEPKVLALQDRGHQFISVQTIV